jgi:tetratricopeptide (TPR) repeat protein
VLGYRYCFSFKLSLATALITLATLLTTPEAQAQAARATIFSLQGSATIQRGGSVVAASAGMSLNPGDEVIVGTPGRVALEMPDGSYVRLPGGARMKLGENEKPVSLLQGALHFFSHSEQHPTIATDHVTAAIRGTEFTVDVEQDATVVKMVSGSLDGTSKGGAAHLVGGQGARFTSSGRPPQLFAILSSERNAQWSVFVPAVGTDQELDALATASPEISTAIALLKEGESAKALAALPHDQDPCGAASILRAKLLSAQGDPLAGRELLSRCLSRSPNAPLASLAASDLAIASLVMGDPKAADTYSLSALQSAPDSEAARLSRSFVLQERADLAGALATLGSRAETDSSDLRARRAEVLMMMGEVPEAREQLEAITDRSWYAETVLGFARMADRSFDAAFDSFSKASKLEPAAGLPELGLGLIAVNRGNLQEGTQHFERATVLEPSRSMYRSYLAKSYFESDTYSPAEPEYERAIALDPNDPTPHLYRSFMRVAQNRPVEALEDLEKSQELSTGRAVYRSSNLLDEDAAVQSASLSRAYRDLGFVERGRIEAISAIMSDYRNASAHRLLAESQERVYSADASLSERRIADLFAPLSVNVVDSIGSGVSLNEYSSLFERDGWRTGISTGYGSLDDIGHTAVMTARKSGNMVTGLSASGTVTNGLDSSPRSTQGNVGLSLQAQPTWGDRLLFEGRGFFGQSDNADEDNHFDNGSATGAYLHRFSPNVSAIAQTHFERSRDQLKEPNLNGDLLFRSLFDGQEETNLLGALYNSNTDRYESLWINEAQLLAKTGLIDSILTLRTSRNDVDNFDEKVLLEEESETLNGLGVTYNSVSPAMMHSDLISYLSTIKPTRALSLNVGTAYEHVEWESRTDAPFEGDTDQRSRLSPRAGIVYNPSSAAMARVSYTESLGKGIQNDLVSLDPTLVGGITQRFNDLPGTFARNLGTGLDLRPTKTTYVGSEWIRRWLQESSVDGVYSIDVDYNEGTATRGTAISDDSDTSLQQDFVSAYLYQVISKQFVLGTDYRYSREWRDLDVTEALYDHRGRLLSRYFFTSGLFLQGTATYRYQERSGGSSETLGSSSNAWLMGAGVGYRLPTRHGIILAEVDNIFGQDIVIDDTTYFQDIVDSDPMVRLAANFNF